MQVMRYWEDVSIGELACFGRHRLDSDEIEDFKARFMPPAFVGTDGDEDREAVPGLMLCCITMRLLVEHCLVGLASRGSPGVDRIDWPAAAHVGDVVGLCTEVLASRALNSRPDMGLIQQHVRMHNHKDETVARMWSNVLIARRETAA